MPLPMSAGLLTTFTPGAESAAIFSAAVPFSSCDNRACVTYAPSRRRRLSCDERDHGLLEVRFDPRSGFFFNVTLASGKRVFARSPAGLKAIHWHLRKLRRRRSPPPDDHG